MPSLLTVTRTKSAAISKVGLSLKQTNGGKIVVSKVHAQGLFAKSPVQPHQELVQVNGIAVSSLSGGVRQVASLLQTHNTITLVLQEKHGDDTMAAFLIDPVGCVLSKLFPDNKKRQRQTKPVDLIRERTLTFSKVQQFIYVSLFGSLWWIIFTRAIPLNQQQHYLPTYHHQVWTWVVFVSSLISWLAAKFVKPGTITCHNLQTYDNYHYDGILYVSGKTCPLWNIPKLARSKLDRYSQQHVPRFDHFCGWLGNSLGEENYRYFLAFLVSHTIMLLYGALAVGYLLYQESVKVIADDDHHHYYHGSQWSVVKIHPGLAVVFMVTFLATIPVGWFLGFHLSLIRKGMTTNEYYKWNRILLEQAIHYEGGNGRPVICDGDIESMSHRRHGTNTIQHDLLPTAHTNTNKNNRHCHSYNLGFLANLHEVLFPRSLRREMHTAAIGCKES